MTNSEAIKYGKDQLEIFGGQHAEFIRMAIEALQQGCEKVAESCDDYISRLEATSIPILPKEHRKIFKSIDDAFETGWNEALSCVNMLPSAQPERKKGEWIDENNIPVGWDKVDKSCPSNSCKCSNCGEWLVASDEYCVKGNFCPNCGADMRGEQE